MRSPQGTCSQYSNDAYSRKGIYFPQSIWNRHVTRHVFVLCTCILKEDKVTTGPQEVYKMRERQDTSWEAIRRVVAVPQRKKKATERKADPSIDRERIRQPQREKLTHAKKRKNRVAAKREVDLGEDRERIGQRQREKPTLGVLPPKLYFIIKALIHKVQLKGKLLGRSPLSPQQPILFTLGRLSSGSRGVSLVGLLKLSNEAQGEVRVTLVKQCFGFFRILKRGDGRKQRSVPNPTRGNGVKVNQRGLWGQEENPS